MNLLQLSIKNMLTRPLSTGLSVLLITLGVGMISLLVQVSHQVREQLEKNVRGIDMVVGAKGSPLQLILSAVFHIDTPTGNVPLAEVTKLRQSRLVASVIPLSYGDSHRGYRIVGTDTAYLSLYETTVAEGRHWQQPLEVTLGATVARDLALTLGDTLVGAHGLGGEGEDHESHAYRVVGILAPSNAVPDQLILTATESVWAVHEHDAADTTREVTAMLVKFRSPMGLVQLPRFINEKTPFQAALPALESNRLFTLMGVGIDTLHALAAVIMLVSGLSVFISLYNALRERRTEMALLRSYGASRGQLLAVVLQEGLLLSLAGYALGIIFSRLGLWFTANVIAADYHYTLEGSALLPDEWWLLAVTIGVGLLASIIPAIQAASVNISQTLAEG